LTTGTSSGEAFDIVRANGGIPMGCAIAFDRQERGNDGERSATQEFTKNYGILVYAAATLDDLILLLEEGPAIPKAAETLPKILAYRDQYGAK